MASTNFDKPLDTEVDDLREQIGNYVYYENKTLTAKTVTANTTTVWTEDISKTGYTPIMATFVSTGVETVWCYYSGISGNTLTFGLYNPTGVSYPSLTPIVRILYVKI